MKTLLLCLWLLSPALLLGGCAVETEDKSFFESGWVRPGDNDARMRQR